MSICGNSATAANGLVQYFTKTNVCIFKIEFTRHKDVDLAMDKSYIDLLREEWLGIEIELELGKSIKKHQPTIKKRMKELFDLGFAIQDNFGVSETSMTFADLLVRYHQLNEMIENESK
jgi:hypothetical protein